MSNLTNNNSGGTELQESSSQRLVNSADFNDEDFQDFIKISEEIVRKTQERRSQRKRIKSRANTMPATMTQEVLFESIVIDDDKFLDSLEHDSNLKKEEEGGVNLLRSIENLMTYFDQEVKVKEESISKSSPTKKSTRGKVAMAVASLRSKCGLTASPLVSKKSSAKFIKTTDIQELKKKYETPMEPETASPTKAKGNAKSPKLKHKTKVKQLALLFSNKINSIITNSSSLPNPPKPTTTRSKINLNTWNSEPSAPDLLTLSSPTFTSILKPKTPKVKSKLATYKIKLPSPKPSPCLKRKPLFTTASISSLTESSVANNSHLQKQSNIFPQLSVKDKVLLYNEFVNGLTKRNLKCCKEAEVLESKVKLARQKAGAVIENQNSVGHSQDNLEANSSPSEPLSLVAKCLETSVLNPSLDTSRESKKCRDILQTTGLEDASQDLVQTSRLTVFLKSSPEANKCLEQTEASSGKKDVTFLEKTYNLNTCEKRTQKMLPSIFCTNPLEPANKVRRSMTHQEHLTPKVLFHKSQVGTHFYQWLNNKNNDNDVASDVTATDHKNNAFPSISTPQEEVQNISELASSQNELSKEKANQNKGIDIIKNVLEKANRQEKPVIEVELPLEGERQDGIDIIKNVLENANRQEKPVIEVELPLEGETKDGAFTPNAESDFRFSANKLSSGESATALNADKGSSSVVKHLRKKKTRRNFTLKVTRRSKVFSTDSDSDSRNKYNEILDFTSSTPITKEPYNFVEDVIKDQGKTLRAEQSHTDLYNNEAIGLDDALLRQMNSQSKIKTAYTLTAMSTPSPYSGSDAGDTELQHISHIKRMSRSCPTLIKANLVRNTSIGFFRDKSTSEELTDFVNSKSLKEQQKILKESFTDQGFSTCSNQIDSPVRIIIKTNCNFNKKSLWPVENKSIFHKANTSQPAPDQFTPITATALQQRFVNPQKVIYKDDLPAAVVSERTTTAGSLNDSTFSSEASVKTPYNFHLNVKLLSTSQFWISSGDFTAAVTIHYCEPGHLMFLNNIYAQKSLETKEMNFGIDDQKFCLDPSAASNQILEQKPQIKNCSQYWFSTGSVLIPFQGPYMTNEKIHKFFDYIRGFMEETESLRFGVDGYEFSNIYQQAPKSLTPIHRSPWTKIVTSPLRTSDLEQSDPDLEELGQSLTVSSLGSVERILQQFGRNEKLFISPETLKTSRYQQAELKIIEKYPVETTAL